MKTKMQTLVIIGLLILLMITGYMLMGRDVTVVVNGESTLVHTRALTVGQVLHSMGITLNTTDKIDPPASTWLSKVQTITLDRSRPMILWVEPNGARVDFTSAAQTPREALAQMGVTPAEEDKIQVNGNRLGWDDPLPTGKNIVLQFAPVANVTLTLDGQTQTLRSSAASLGLALWQNNFHLNGGDAFSIPFTQPLYGTLNVIVTRAMALAISVDGITLQTSSAAPTVGQALAEAGISLQGNDYSAPSEDSPLPADGKIKVVRVKLVLSEDQKVTPYTVEYTTDNSLATGTREVTQTGQNGISARQVIIRYEDGVEVSRDTRSEVVLQSVINEKVTIGPGTTTSTSTPTTESGSSEGGIGTIMTEAGEKSYYLSAPVHLTSYSPCRTGTSTCSNLTASGTPVVQGVLGVTSAWYRIFKGYQIYIPGYGIGTVEDIGGGIAGEYWIDLGYSDADWVNWSKTITVYFLSPAPAGFSGSLP